MKNISIVLLFFLITIVKAQQFADSAYLNYEDGRYTTNGDVLITDVAVDQDTLYTYYAALEWDDGYTGLQDEGDNLVRDVHYSVWDHLLESYSNSVFNVTWNTLPWENCGIQFSSDLLNWSLLGEFPLSSNSFISTLGDSNEFFRVYQ